MIALKVLGQMKMVIVFLIMVLIIHGNVLKVIIGQKMMNQVNAIQMMRDVTLGSCQHL
jgi:hypothetical protein